MGRKKIKIARIEDERSRQVTFLKRRNGVMKKAHELAVLTGSDVGLIIFNGQGKLSEFCSGDMRTLLHRYSQYSGPAETRGPQFYENLSRDKEDDDDDDDQDTVSFSAGPSTSLGSRTSSAMDAGMTSSSTQFGSGATSASTSSMGTDLRLVQPMDPPSGAFGLPFGLRSSMGDIHDTKSMASSGHPNPTRFGPITHAMPSDVGGASGMSPLSFNSSRASSIAGHMSGITFGTSLHQRLQDAVFDFDQPTALPSTSQFGMNSHTQNQHYHQLQQQQQQMSSSSLAARRSSFPTQHVDHSMLAGPQIVRPATSAGGIQPSLHAMAPAASPFSGFSFQSFQPNPSPMTTMAPTMSGSHAPPSAWHNLTGPLTAPTSNFSQFGGMPSRPQLFSTSSDSRMPSSTTLMQHDSTFGADQDTSQANLVENINQAYKKRKQSGSDWPTGSTTSAAAPLRFSASIPTQYQDQHSSGNASALSSLNMPLARQSSFSSAMGMSATPGSGGAAPLPFGDSQFNFNAHAVAGGLPHGGLHHTASSSSAGSSISPVSTGTSAPGVTASVSSAPSSSFDSPSLASGGKIEATSYVSSHGAGGTSTLLTGIGQADMAPVPTGMNFSNTSSISGDDAGPPMGAVGSGSTGSVAGLSADTSLEVGMDLGQFMGRMMSQHAAENLASHHQQQQQQQNQQYPFQLQHHDPSSEQPQPSLLQAPVDAPSSDEQSDAPSSDATATMSGAEHLQFSPQITDGFSNGDVHAQVGSGDFVILAGQSAAASAMAAPPNVMSSYGAPRYSDNTTATGSASALPGYTEMQTSETQSSGSQN
ncbi:unnamed protein product [Tilletia controversa]|uniref:MADS-box domain-containing protein n=1 Tax=Tilletia controversa TaxID=13291 RepID=A0A8X7MQ63_9BASI|nr:hypothetical protein CF328_g4962 [Tilletia controversa]KAE8243878.1 hypothetical protein A4X06_0g6072 [Tilletia controversa]CAD6903240.1 unnamed protein product [Tilletia controversa]CAD6940116.1 unnamed protein product [Tilletia controversa]CAD6947391.1 unnamed protein product [Tilletia controversa]